MGPRPIGRGFELVECGVLAGQVASMGPRPIGRGFNGARPGLMFGTDRFNGAASDRTRIPSGVVQILPRGKLLQWGRVRSDADSSPF